MTDVEVSDVRRKTNRKSRFLQVSLLEEKYDKFMVSKIIFFTFNESLKIMVNQVSSRIDHFHCEL